MQSDIQKYTNQFLIRIRISKPSEFVKSNKEAS